MKCKSRALRITALVLTFCMVVSIFSSCGEKTAVSNAYKNFNTTLLVSGKLTENNNYELLWDSDAQAVIYQSKGNGKHWSNILYESFLAGSDSVNVRSSISITVANTKTLKWDTVSSFSQTEDNGSVVCKKIDGGIRVTYFFDVYKIAIPVEYILYDDHISVAVDSSIILEDGSDYKLVSVSVSPNFCSVRNDAENGFLFVPSGSGAIMYTDENANGTRKYSGEVYGSDAARQVPKNISDDEAVRLPVFGASGDGAGLLGIIEKGAGAATIEAQSGNEKTGYSNVCANFSVRGYDEFFYTFHGQYKGLTKRLNESISGLKFSVSYYPLFGDAAGYNGMAEKYRAYLLKKGALESSEIKNVAYSVTVLGGTNITKSFFGVPYQKLVALTTFSQTKSLIQKFVENTGVNPVLRMMGYGDNGIRPGKICGGKSLPSVYGSNNDLKDLLNSCKGDIFLDADIVNFSASGNGFSLNFDVAQTAISHKAEHFPVSPTRINDKDNPYYILARDKLKKASELAVKKANNYGFDSISFSSLGTKAFSDFSDMKYANKNSIESDVSSILHSVKKEGYKTAVSSSNIYAACAADILFDISVSNGDYDDFDVEIPFYQMVFHSYKSMYSPAVNLSENKNLSVAKSAAYGMGLGYTLTYGYVDESDDLDTYKLYGTVFEDNIANIVNTLINEKYLELYSAIYNAQFIDYEILDNGVSKSEYSNGVIVYVNHTQNNVQCPTGELKPFSFSLG